MNEDMPDTVRIRKKPLDGGHIRTFDCGEDEPAKTYIDPDALIERLRVLPIKELQDASDKGAHTILNLCQTREVLKAIKLIEEMKR